MWARRQTGPFPSNRFAGLLTIDGPRLRWEPSRPARLLGLGATRRAIEVVVAERLR